MIRLAQLSDLEKMMAIITAVIGEMRQAGNDQWDEHYPLRSDFLNDLETGNLYVTELNGELTGFVCINDQQPEAYQDAGWSACDKSLVIHRMAVNPAYRNRGVASMLMTFAEELGRSKGVTYLRSDTYSQNAKMNALFRKMNYRFTGEIRFFKKPHPFHCYEKALVQREDLRAPASQNGPLCDTACK